MARAYTIATAALTLGMPIKWLDNTLSHIRVPGVRQERQGVARRITIDGLLILAVATLLINELGIPLASAIESAEKLVYNGGQYASPNGVSLQLNLEKLTASLLERLENAVEIAPVPRRGRPPKIETGRLT
jgi:ABC-type amino acid transport system permease subunit